jgi:zinc protease
MHQLNRILPSSNNKLTHGQLASLSPGDVLPMDPRVVRGVLPNGMAFYVMANGEPRNRAELSVVIKSGSIHEDEHERGNSF